MFQGDLFGETVHKILQFGWVSVYNLLIFHIKFLYLNIFPIKPRPYNIRLDFFSRLHCRQFSLTSPITLRTYFITLTLTYLTVNTSYITSTFALLTFALFTFTLTFTWWFCFTRPTTTHPFLLSYCLS